MGIELRQGEVVADRYRLDRVLGEGGMGVVWAATHTRTSKTVALKFVKRARESSDVAKRFLREARAACAVTHANVREIHDILELQDGSPMMVMEYLLGESLAQRLERERTLPVEEAARILVQVVSAVGTAHALGIVHRDLKPENVFLTEGPAASVKVLDFGIAKLAPASGGRDETKLTHSGALLGTPCYMSPEQVFGETDIDHRSDIWALGLIAYRALSGVLPTEADNVGQVMKVIVTRSIRPLEELAPDLPKDVCAIVNRMLARRRDHRPDSLLEVQAVLVKYTGERAASFSAPVVERGSDAGREALTASPGLVTIEPEDEAALEANGDAPTQTSEAPSDGPASARHDSVRPLTTGTTKRVSRGLAAGAGALAVAGVVSLAWWSRTDPRAGEAEPPASGVQAAGVVTASTSALPAPTPAPHPSATEERTVSVAIEPRTATVIVDGHEVRVADGAVKLTGALGSRHEVRITVGTRSKAAQVVVTQDGAFPAKLSLGAEEGPRAAGASSSRATATAAPKGPGTAAPAAPATPKPFQESEKFE